MTEPTRQSLCVHSVVRWIRPTKKIQYHFGRSGKSSADHRYIPDRCLFQDDTRIDTLTKLYVFLDDYYAAHPAPEEWPAAVARRSVAKRNELPLVAWDYQRGFLLTPDGKWETWMANPWKLSGTPEALTETLGRLPQQPSHESHATQLTQLPQFAFACLFDLPLFETVPQLKRWYGLYNDTKPVLTREAVLEQTRILSKLMTDSAQVAIQSEWLDEYNEMGSFSLTHRTAALTDGTPAPPKVLFDLLPVSATVPLVQWKEGRFLPALYRLYKHHALDLDLYTSLDKVPAHEQRIQIVAVAMYKNQPVVFKCIMVFGKNHLYTIHVKVKERNADVAWLETQVKTLKQTLAKFSNDYRLRFTSETTHLKARYILPAPFAIQRTHWSSFGWLFHVQRTPGGGATTPMVLTYLRSANAHQRLNPEAFIQSQMAFIDDPTELVRVIQDTFMIPEAKARELLQEYNDGRDVSSVFVPGGKKRSWVEVPATVSVVYQPTTNQLLVQCDRFLNSDDLTRMMVWMRGALVQIGESKQPSRAPPKPPAPTVFFMDNDSPEVLLSSSSASAVSSRRSRSATSTSSTSSARSDASSVLGGGAYGRLIGGTFDLIEPLKKADPEIFIHTKLPNNTSRYPRLCSANTNQQPVVVSQEEMKKIDSGDYKNSYDSKLLYGSDKDPKKHHYYFCPRIWCPISKVPLSPEQYEALGHKCPAPHKEDPWLFYDADYWGRNATVPHHIGFHKKQGTNNLCLPCCKRIPEKDTGIKKCSAHVAGVPSVPPPEPEREREPEKKLKKTKEPKPEPEPEKPTPTPGHEDYYLLHFAAPISAKRWGVIPEVLHQRLKPDQPYTHCYNQLKTEPLCLVRKGIHHHRDSLLNALGYILTRGTGGKREALTLLEKHMTPLEFLMIHNGWGVANFIDPEPVLPQKHLALLLKWRDWVRTYPDYVRAFHLAPLLERVALVSDLSATEQLRLSRELAIFIAWRRFWDYLTSSEPKNIYFMFDLVYVVFGLRLVVWEKHGNDEVYLKCPLGAAEETHRSLLYDTAPVAMVMYENAYYEPVELKSRGTPGKTQLSHGDPVKTHLDTMLRKCAGAGAGAGTGESLQSYVLLATLPETLGAPELAPKTLVVSPAMTVVGIVLASGVFVQWRHPVPLRYMKELQDLLRVKPITYLEDLEGVAVPPPVALPTHQVSAYMRLLKECGFKWNVQTVAADPTGILSKLTLKPMTTWTQLDIAVIPTGTLTPTEEIRMLADAKQAYYIRLQRNLGRALLRAYPAVKTACTNGGLAAVLKLPAIQSLGHATMQKDIQRILEEIPLIQGKKIIPKETLYQWFIAIGSSEQYPIYTVQVKDGFTRNEWLFSQGAVATGLPEAIRVPAKTPYAPKKLPVAPMRVMDFLPERAASQVALPALEWAPLPNKWLQKKHYGWEAYRRAPVGWIDAMRWLLSEYRVSLSLDTFAVLHSMKVAEMLHADDSAVWEHYLQDPFIWRGLAKHMAMEKSKMPTVIKYFLKLSKADQWRLWESLAANGMAAVDLDLWLFAHLTHSVLLVLHRSPSGKGVETAERHRFQDFVSSATVFCPEGISARTMERLPLAVFFKEAKIDAVQSSYYIVEHTPSHKKYFQEMRQAPETLQRLIRAVATADAKSATADAKSAAN